MAASKELISGNVLSFDVTECGICLEPFKKPKALPCLHMFCLECLEKYGKDEVPEAKLPCPFCRREFTIPKDGFKNLPGNFFIEQLAEERKYSSISATTPPQLVCEMCDEEDRGKSQSSSVTKYCVDCGQNACDICVRPHKNARGTRNHKVVPIEDGTKHQTLMKS